MLAGILLAGAAAALTLGVEDWLLTALALVASFGLLGWVDDVRALKAKHRLLLQFLIATAGILLLRFEFVLESRSLTSVAAIVGIVGFVNVFNFMDGINGISGVTAAIGGATIAASASAAGTSDAGTLGAAVSGGAIGFLPFNFPHARVFLGDVGSYTMGSALAIGAMQVLEAGASPMTVVAPFMLYVTDVGLTLIRRSLMGKNLFDAHKEHAYQLRASGGWGHTRTTAVAGGLTLLFALLGFASEAHPTFLALTTAAVLGGSGWFAFGPQYRTLTESHSKT